MHRFQNLFKASPLRVADEREMIEFRLLSCPPAHELASLREFCGWIKTRIMSRHRTTT